MQAMNLQEKVGAQYKKVATIHEKSQKTIQFGESAHPKHLSTGLEKATKFNSDFEELI